MKISVITVCKNSEKTISETIQSVLSQTYNDFELIIVDGKSTDNTLNIINDFKSDKIRLISENDTGIYNAMNKGVNLSTGDYLFFLNSDDKFLHNNVLTIFAQEMEKTHSDLIFGTYFFINKNTGKYGIKQQRNLSKFDLWQACPLQPTLFYNKDLFEKHGLMEEKYKICADYEFSLRLILKNKVKFHYVDTPVTIFDTNGVSSSVSEIHLQERTEIDNIYFSKIELKLFKLLNFRQGRKLLNKKFMKNIFKIPD